MKSEVKMRKAVKRPKMARGAPSRSKLIKTADTLYSKLIRQKYAKNGIVGCYTCPYEAPIKNMQCGHYISRFYKYTRWDIDNLRPQCYGCNIRMSGNAFIFRAKLVAELGEKRVKEMEIAARILFKEPDSWIEDKIAYAESHLQVL